MGSNCVPYICFYFERGFMLSFSDNNKADDIEALNSTSRYLDTLLYTYAYKLQTSWS